MSNTPTPRRLAILGSTGSIGTQALDVVKRHPDRFVIEVLTAQNSADLLIAQAREFAPNVVVIGNEDKYTQVQEALADTEVKVYAGEKSMSTCRPRRLSDSPATRAAFRRVGRPGPWPQ